MEPDIVLVRATIHLPDGIFPGEFYWVDRNRPYIADAIEAGVLVAEPSAELSDPTNLETRGWSGD